MSLNEIMRKNLKLLREEKKWSLENLSKISEIDIETLSDIEKGKDFDIDLLFILCRIYNIKVYRIFSPL